MLMRPEHQFLFLPPHEGDIVFSARSSVLIEPGPGVEQRCPVHACFGKLTSSGSIFTQATLLSVQMFATGRPNPCCRACPRAPS